MIFYLAINDEGHTKIVGTQADAGKINKDFSQIDIPTDKGGLMAWVQQMLDELLNSQPAAEANDDERFLVACVSEDGTVSGIDHPTDAPWETVLNAHVALRDRLDERIAEQNGCPLKPQETITIATADMRADKDGAPSISHTIPANPKPAPMTPQLSKILTVEYIQNWLIEDADQREIERIFNAIGCRIGEMLREDRG